MTDSEKIIDEAFSSAMPFESWEQLKGESSLAYSAFRTYRDLGAERSIRKAVEAVEQNEAKREKRCRVWRNWSTLFRWKERAADYDRYLEKLRQTEIRKMIEAQGEVHRKITGKMLDVVYKKLDTMNPEDLTQGTVTDWVTTAIKSEREAAGFTAVNKTDVKQGELNFVTDFKGL